MLLSSYLQGAVDKAKRTDPCSPAVTSMSFNQAVAAGVASSADAASGYWKQSSIQAGTRTLKITRHAAERMVERGVSRRMIHAVVDSGKLFAYKHTGGRELIKIGYYSPVNRVFVAVDQTHQKIITVIGNVPIEYVRRLINL